MTKFVIFILFCFLNVVAIDRAIAISAAESKAKNLKELQEALASSGKNSKKVRKKTNKRQQLKILKSKLDALNKRNRKLSNSLQKSINYSRQKQKFFDEAFDKFKNSNRSNTKTRQGQKKLKDELLKVKDELALSKSQKNDLEKEIKHLLSSDVDIWKVVENKTVILKKIKDELITNTKKHIFLLNKKLVTGKKEITKKRKRLVSAKSKILAKYADRERLLSRIVDDKNILLTKKINLIQKRIEKILNKKNKFFLKRQAELTILKQVFQKKKDNAFAKQQKKLTRIENNFSEDIKKWVEVLDKTDPSLSHNRFTFEHTNKLEVLVSDYDRKKDTLTKALNLVEAKYKIFSNGEKADFNFMLSSANEGVKKVKKQLNDIKNKISKINQNSDKQISILTENREIDYDSFKLRRDKLKEKIAEVNYVSDEVMRDNIARLQHLKARLNKLNLEIKQTNIDETVYTKKEQLAIVKMQVNALAGTDLSLKSVNKSIKNALMNSLKRLHNIEDEQVARYQKKYQQIDKEKNDIIKKELKKLKSIKSNYHKVLALYRKKDKRNNAIIVEKEKRYQEQKLEVEDKLKNIQDVFEYKKSSLIDNYQIVLSQYDNDIKNNQLTRTKALREKRNLMDLWRLEKRELIRNYDLSQQRLKKTFVSRKEELESEISDIEYRFSGQIKTLKEKETQFLSEKNQNELEYKSNIKTHIVTRDFALEGIEKVLEDLHNLENKIIGETTEKLIALKKNKAKSEKEFITSLANLDLAQKSFEKFLATKKNLTKDKQGLVKYTKNIMDSFNLLVEKENMYQKSKKPRQRKGITKDRNLRILEDILVKSKAFKPKYELIDGGCFIPDSLEKKQICVKDFYMSNHEVTNAEYRKIYPDHYSGKFERQPLSHDNQPVVRVSWLDALAYAKEISKKTGVNYRLPTENEWEYAARAGVKENKLYPKDIDACFYANVADATIKKEHPKWIVHNCLDGFYVSSPVGYYKPNNFGLYDMLGNVWEWTCPKYEKLISGKLSCVGLNAPKSVLKVSRGGSWFSSPKSMRFGFKYAKPYDFVDKNVGFRLVREVE